MGVPKIHNLAFSTRSHSNWGGKKRADYTFMDDATLTVAFKAHSDGESNFTRRMVILIADMAEMRPMALVWRLEKMKLLKRGSWQWFRDNGGITKAQVREVLTERDVDLAATSDSEVTK